MKRKEKCTIELKLHLTETMYNDLKRDAAQSGQEALSPHVRNVLRTHLYGHLNPHGDLLAGAVRDE